MNAQMSEPQFSEVTAALIDLATLSRRASGVPPEGQWGIASALLVRLLKLCRAERGAVFLRADRGSFAWSEPASPAVAKQTYRLRVLALHEMREEEAAALLVTEPVQEVPIWGPDTTLWMIFHLPVGAGKADDAPRGLPGASAAFEREEQEQDALLVLGWSSEPEQTDAATSLASRCAALLPLLTEAAGAVISALVLNERMNDAEHTSIREALGGMELLKAELLGTVSHELRSPLASIKGYAATLLRHEHHLGRDERHQFLLAIAESSDRLEAIIERLLEVSQLETDQIDLQRSPVDVVRLASEAIASIQEQVEASRPGHFVFRLWPEYVAGVPAGAIPLVLADRRRLREVLDNLLDNAVTYSPEGGLITVTVRLRGQDHPQREGEASGQERAISSQHELEICICDQGQGIPAAQLERIFERFQRVDTSLTRETGGLGLGLTICKRIVELHGGAIWAAQGPQGRGSAFYVRLPVEAGEQL